MTTVTSDSISDISGSQSSLEAPGRDQLERRRREAFGRKPGPWHAAVLHARRKARGSRAGRLRQRGRR